MSGLRLRAIRLTASSPKLAPVSTASDRERFARFGSDYVAASLQANARRLVVVENADVDDDLVRDRTEVLRSFCAHLYGGRAAPHRAGTALAAVQESDDAA